MPDPRDHGYGDDPQVEGPPKVVETLHGRACPECGCETLMMIEVRVKNPSPLLRLPEGHYAAGIYAGCPACPFASPMVTAAKKETV